MVKNLMRGILSNTKSPEGILAIDGGPPVRATSLPWETPGAHWIGSEEVDQVSDVLKNRSPYRYYGPNLQHKVDTLERVFAERIGRKYAVATASGTTALSCSFAALGVGPGDEVLVPGYLWVSCFSAVVRLGAIPRLVDIDDTFNISPEDLANKIGDRSKALLLVHMSGAPGDIDAIMKIARDTDLKVVEDCAQANGARYKGKPVGSFGDLAIFSFQMNKNMTAGEGGMIVCDDKQLYRRCFASHDMGYALDESNPGQLDTQDESCQLWGIGARMGEVIAAVALAQLGKLDKITGAMRNAKYAIRDELEKIEGIQCRRIVDPDGDSGPFLITTLPTAESCKTFAEALKTEGIKGADGSAACISMEEWHLHWYWNNLSLVNRRSLNGSGWPWTAPDNAFAKEYRYERGALPNCDDLASRSILLTIASCLNENDVDDIVHAYRKVAAAVL